MEGQPFFTTIAGLSVSLAGFGAVIAWLRDDPTGWDPINLWRVRTIVRHALTIAFLCLSLMPIHTITGDDLTTLRIGSALVAVFAANDLWRARDRDPAIWTPKESWIVYVTLTSAFGIACVVNVFLGDLGLLQVVVLILLTSPAGIFLNFVREIGSNKPTSA
ncbi:MAG TPA: hypothetical protein VFS66_08800 [Acidimicrobiia bacterium]|nr:hypothetical protein [Acidimicrobiia bacterium]